MTLLIHYSAEPLGPLVFVAQEPMAMKPKGLWFSVEDGYGWKDWCDQEDWGGDRLDTRTMVQLRDNANVLKLTHPKDLDAFTEAYRDNDLPEPMREIYGMRPMFLDWVRVANEYHGIVIAPYCWDRRMELPWYYGWDCSSGCVWHQDAIKGIGVME